MKVIHVLAGKANPKVRANGVNVCVDLYADLMHASGMDVEVWGIAGNPHTNLPHPAYPIHFFQQHKTLTAPLDGALVDRARSMDGRSTVFHFHGGFIREYPKLMRLVPGAKYFCMPHSAYSDPSLAQRWWRKKAYLAMVERDYLRHSRGLLIFNDRESGERLAIPMDDMPRHVVSKGADPVFLATEPVAKDPADSPVVWGFCGRIHDAHKAVDRLIRSFLTFRRQCGSGRQHVLSIMGDGPDFARIHERYRPQIRAGIVLMHGAVYGEAKLAEHRRMHYFVHPSNWEGVPQSCLDALALGIPLLVTPGTLVDQDVAAYCAGVVVQPTEESIVRGMHELMEMERSRLTEGCLRLIREKYSWQRGVDQFKALYAEALAA